MLGHEGQNHQDTPSLRDPDTEKGVFLKNQVKLSVIKQQVI